MCYIQKFISTYESNVILCLAMKYYQNDFEAIGKSVSTFALSVHNIIVSIFYSLFANHIYRVRSRIFSAGSQDKIELNGDG